MPILARLMQLYEKRGYEVATGLFPPHFGGWRDVAFTWLIHQGRSVTSNLGIAQQELYFLENLLAEHQPERILIIGNSFGWSTLALALLCPEARVVAIDACLTADTNSGLVLTNMIAREEQINAIAVRGTSPQDVPAIVGEYLRGRVDLALIDGHHTNEAAWADYQAIKPFVTPESLYLFHDVQTFKLYEAVKKAQADSGWTAQLTLGTPSGIVALFDAVALPSVARAIKPFVPSAAALAALEGEYKSRKERAAAKQAAAMVKPPDAAAGS